jgi:hypothetical protein
MRERFEDLGIVRFSSDEEEVSANIVKGPGEILGLTVTNATEEDGFVQVHDSATLPETGALPVIRFKLSGEEGKLAGFSGKVPVKHGAIAVISTTLGTYTPSENGAWFFAIVADDKP